jgi:hypothetical protein
VIPTVLLPALLIGRWWFLPVASVGWAVVVLVDGSCDLGCSPGAAALGLANAFVGVLVHKAGVLAVTLAGRFATPS